MTKQVKGYGQRIPSEDTQETVDYGCLQRKQHGVWEARGKDELIFIVYTYVPFKFGALYIYFYINID